MKIQSYARGILLSALTGALLLPAVRAAGAPAQESASATATPGTIVGIVLNSAKLPVARATVTAVRAGGSAIRSTLSGSDGIYSFADLPPGTWNITAQAPGYPDAAVPALEVASSKATRYDI